MAELTVISWRSIPAQVVAKEGRTRSSVQLSERFQEAIDLAATRVGLIGTDDYLAQWRRDTRACGDDLEAEARAAADQLEAAYAEGDLTRLVYAGGFEPGENGSAGGDGEDEGGGGSGASS